MKASWRGAGVRCSLFFHRLSPRPRSAGRGGTGLAFTRVCSLGAGVVGNYGAGGKVNYPINFNFKGWWLKITRLMSGMLFIQYSCTFDFNFKVVCMDYFFFSSCTTFSYLLMCKSMFFYDGKVSPWFFFEGTSAAVVGSRIFISINLLKVCLRYYIIHTTSLSALLLIHCCHYEPYLESVKLSNRWAWVF